MSILPLANHILPNLSLSNLLLANPYPHHRLPNPSLTYPYKPLTPTLHISAVGSKLTPKKPHIMKCYQCNSYYDRGCADYFDNQTYPLIPCSAEATMCRKIVQES